MTCRYLNPYDALDAQRVSDVSNALGFLGAANSLGGLGLNNYREMMAPASNPKPTRKDLTPRQIEWCRANIPAFMPRVTT